MAMDLSFWTPEPNRSIINTIFKPIIYTLLFIVAVCAIYYALLVEIVFKIPEPDPCNVTCDPLT